MASYKQGILGAFSGKLGNVIGSFWKGISVMRVVPANVTNPNTLAQQKMREHFRLLVKFLAANAKFFRIGFSAVSARMTEMNSAFKANYDTAVTGIYPTLSIDVKNLVTSKGSLPSLKGFAAVSTVANTIDISWEDNSSEAGATATDKINLAVFDEATGESVTALQAESRLSETASFILPVTWTGRAVSLYAYMTSEEILFGLSKMSQISESVKINGITVV